MKEVFSDQKIFPDCTPLYPIDTIVTQFNIQKPENKSELKHFVATYYDTVFSDTSVVLQHIENLWNLLLREPDISGKNSSLIPLHYPYIVPGGRFREIYYWDSYFTMLGLQVSGHIDIIENMINNFCFLIDSFGFIPNGNRTYYLSRSQPPFFSLMIELLAKEKGDSVYVKYLPFMEMEYLFWMKGKEAVKKKSNTYKRVVNINGEGVLNRYYDELEEPRPESYIYDFNLKKVSERESSIYREIRAAAESGWDFSSRWFDTGLSDIHTTDFIPVDLNSILYKTEILIARAYSVMKNTEQSNIYCSYAEKRAELINKYLYDEISGFYYDLNCKTMQLSADPTLAGCYPLFSGIADDLQAEKVREVLWDTFLKDGGMVTTIQNTGQQWDWPNGWPPLQWVAFLGLKNYGYNQFANEIARRWINLNVKVFFETGRLTEKYNVININVPGGGGEYPLQDGFGWTNGVFLRFWTETRNSNSIVKFRNY